MRRSLLSLALLLVVAACSSSADDATTTTVAPSAVPSEIRLLALGDSYTAGTGIDPAGRWPAQLLVELSESYDATTLNEVAGQGWNTKRLSRELARAGLDGEKHDVVILAIGVNDLVQGFGEVNFLEGLELLRRQMITLTTDDGRVLVLSLPDFRVSPWGQERLDREYQIERYNQLLEEYATEIGATYVDLTTVSARGSTDPLLIADDDLHFSAAMYALWVDIILDVLRTP